MIKPYLSLRDRISQTWINRYTIFLILIALKLVLFHSSLRNSIKLVQDFTIQSCPTVDSFASNTVSIPHHLSKSINYMLLKSIDEVNARTVDTLKLILTGTENMVIFTIDMIVGTYACVLVSTIDGAVDVAVNSTEHVISWVNETLIDITDDIEDGLEDLSKVVNKFISAADKVKDFFTDDDEDSPDDSFNKVNLTISGLKNLQIPSSINDKLESLKENMPDFDTVRNKTENLIRVPFDLVKSKIDNTTLISDDDSNKLYVPPIIESNICSDNTDSINEFYNTLNHDITKVVKILVILLILASILVIIPMIWEEFRNWKKLRVLNENLENDKDHIESYEAAYNKYPTSIGRFTSKLSQDPENKITIRWIMSYFLSSRSLIVCGIGIAALLAVILQFILLSVLKNAVNDNDKAPFNSMAQNLTTQFDNSITTWTDTTNDFIYNKEHEINDELFTWVRNTTSAVNSTISEFVDEMNEAISDAFGGTILYNPVKTIVGCVIENKLLKIEQGLTWVHDNTEIKLPRVSDDYLMNGMPTDTDDNKNVDLVSKSKEMVDKTEDLMMRLLNTTIKSYEGMLMTELYIALGILGIWLLQLLIATIVGVLNNKFGTNELFNFDKDPSQEKWTISNPKQLTKDEQRLYNYPITRDSDIQLSAIPITSLTGPGIRLDPIKEEKLEKPIGRDFRVSEFEHAKQPFNSNSTDSVDTIDSSFPFNFDVKSNKPYLSDHESDDTISDMFQNEARSRVISRYE